MTTVAFVSYKFADNPRHVGPMPREAAESMAKEVCRKPMVTEVFVEEWVCLRTRKVEDKA